MISKIRNINAYILAGGKSSRMGSDKGLLNFNGKPIVQIIIEQLKPSVEKIIIVSMNAAYKKFGMEVIPDLMKEKGPAGGIHAALSHSNSEQIFVVSCDMPNITTNTIQYMIEHASHSEITLALNHGKAEPLFGVYSKKCLPLWQQLIEQGIIKLQEMITHFDLLKIDVGNNELFNDSLFLNINDKNDFQKAVKQLQHGN
ncbi:MAG: molybdenum cofactor guanylyltransferase [Bacteroidota bacterium]